MNRRLYLCIAALCLGLSSTFASTAAGSTTNPAEVAHIAIATKQSSAVTAEQKQEIDTFVTAHMTILTTGTPATRSGAKGELLKEAPGTAGGYSPQYLDAFAASVDQQIVAALKTKPSLEVRLNLAVLAAKLASNTSSFQLVNAAQALLQDDAEAVALWGMRAAKNVLPYVIAVAPNSKLLPMMVDVSLKFPGPVLVEGYQGLTMDQLNIAIPKNAVQFQVQIKAVVPLVQTLLSKRIEAYAGSAPKEPSAETIGTGFLSSPKVWEFQTAAQKKDTLKVYHDLLSKVASVYTAPSDELLGVTKRIAQACSVTAGDSDAAVKAACVKVGRLNMSDPAPKVVADMGALISALEPLTPAPAAAGGAATQP